MREGIDDNHPLQQSFVQHGSSRTSEGVPPGTMTTSASVQSTPIVTMPSSQYCTHGSTQGMNSK